MSRIDHSAGGARNLVLAGVGLLMATSAQPAAVRIVAVGDIACSPQNPSYLGGLGTPSACAQRATSDLAASLAPQSVLLLGDNQYETGALADYLTSFHSSWGRLGELLRPVPGNHEYLSAGAQGYYAYFGAAAGDPQKGYYSFELADWHVVALNSNCGAVGGCQAGSEQERWLRDDLAAHAGRCTLAFWHQPRFSSGAHGNDAAYQGLWQALYDAGADIVLNGHEHIYERFAPQSPQGEADPQGGLRQFTVGTGGRNLTAYATLRANSEVRQNSTFGVLEMTLQADGYAWRYWPVSGPFRDEGFAACHSAQATGAKLELLAGRFSATLSWTDATARPPLSAQPVVSPVGNSGAFWALRPEDWEVTLRLVDGCDRNGFFWVLASGYSRLGTELEITDTWTGTKKTYRKEVGRLFKPIQDRQAFDTCAATPPTPQSPAD
jgi:hypothetical protein